MGLRELFVKEAKCEKCEKTLLKKKLATYDTSHQGKYKNGQSIKICNDCLMQLFYEGLRSFDQTAIVIYPIKKGYNAYAYYDFDSLLNTKFTSNIQREENISLVSDLTELLPQSDTKCSCGENKATYTGCSPEIFNNDPFSWEVNKDTEFEHKYLCKDCLIRELKNKITELDIELDGIFPPIQQKGFLCPWQI